MIVDQIIYRYSDDDSEPEPLAVLNVDEDGITIKLPGTPNWVIYSADWHGHVLGLLVGHHTIL